MVKNPKKGACAARNYGFEISKGDYIQYLDADDLLSTNKIENQLKLLVLKNDMPLAFGQWTKFYNTLDNLTWQNSPINKENLIKLFELNNVKYSVYKNYLIDEMAWQKLISGMYYRLTSTSEIEIEEIIMNNPNISKKVAREMIVQKQLDLKSNKMIRDLLDEATIEYK